jgi:hypothetical protein
MKTSSAVIPWDEPKFIARFFSHVDKSDSDGCWWWMGSKELCGYGVMGVGYRLRRAHRISFCIYHQRNIQPNMVIRHTCDHPACVNPLHLIEGTQAENVADMVERGRSRGKSDQYGEKNSYAKLTREKVRLIKNMLRDGFTQSSIGKLFGVCQGCIHKIANGETWVAV